MREPQVSVEIWNMILGAKQLAMCICSVYLNVNKNCTV